MILPDRYTRIAIVLHWLIAVLILVNLLLVWTVDSFPGSFGRPMIDLHKSIGLTVLGLVILRLLWRVTHTPPPLPAAYRPWEKRAAHAAHWVLYGVIFMLPLSGWLHDSAWKNAAAHPLTLFYVIPWFRIGALANLDPATKEAAHAVLFQVHSALALVLYAMVGVHVAGALKHQFFDRKAELQRMWLAASAAQERPVER